MKSSKSLKNRQEEGHGLHFNHKPVMIEVMDPGLRNYLSEIGRRGGRKSRRTLDSDTARAMVRVREARRAYRRFHTECFWSFDPGYVIGSSDVAWVAAQLHKQGGRAAWKAAEKLCP